MSEYIQINQEKHHTEIVINRPKKKNALTMDMYNTMTSALQIAKKDNSIRVVSFKGSEDCFTSGNDLADFVQNPPDSSQSPVILFLKEIINFSKPIVAAVDGLAIGIGTTMLLHCDFVYATPESSFRLPFVNLGLSPEAGSSYILPRMAGHQKASELLLLGEFFNVKNASDLGFITRIVSRQDLSDTVQGTVSKLIKQPVQALQLTKSLMRKPYQTALAEHFARESAAFAERIVSEEAMQIMQAFLKK